MKKINCFDLPENPDPNCVYTLLPKNPDEEYYHERTDRNIGWITREEQEILRNSVVGIAGCGGMGGLLASIFVRLGVGEVRIADCEVFDASNINRQFAAGRSAIGKSKVFETARLIRRISDDTKLSVYSQGINEETVDDFLSDCDVVCDEIEFWAVDARILLHQQARLQKVSVFNCNTVGFGTRLFFFTHDSATMEDCLGLGYKEAKELQYKIQTKTASSAEINKVMKSVLKGLVPEMPEYCQPSELPFILGRLFGEGKAAIIATNPPMASGFVADHILFYLLKDSGVKRNIVRPVPMPVYLYFDAGRLETKIVRGKW